MTAVSQRINNYLGGVSKQSDSKKYPGQVKECLNGFPDVTQGLTKRPGFKFISKLKKTNGTDFSGTELDRSKWFYIHRQGQEKYIGCITPYTVVLDGTNIESDIYVWNATTGVACTITYSGSSRTYLSAPNPVQNYDVLTIHDSTIITNNQVTVTKQADPTFIEHTRATILLLGTAEEMQSDSFKVSIKIGSTTHTDTYTSAATDGYEEVLDGLKTKIDAFNISGMTVTKYGLALQLDYVVNNTRTEFAIDVLGGADNKGIEVFQDWALTGSHLPPQSFHGHIVEIVGNPNSPEDNYFAEFVQNDPSSGFGLGYWKEGKSPKHSAGLTKSTMPHRLMNTGLNAFTLEQIPYTDRIVGDDITNKHPTFVGQKIEKAFFHGSRLGFLSTDNVCLSASQDVFNFYFKSARVATDADPIDQKVASVRPAVLKGIVPTTQGLILFSKNQQFWLYSESGPLTPSSTKIRAISNMEMDTDVHPIDVGTHMNFISKTPSYTRVFAMQTRGLAESPTVLDISRVVNEWIASDVDTLISSVQNEFIAMSSQNSDTIYFYKTYTDGESLLMEAWFKWKLHGKVQNIAVDQDDMYSITKQGNQYTMSVANLSQSPEQAIIVNNQGQKVNPCVDLYTKSTGVRYRHLTAINITNGGSGYSSGPPGITISAPFSGTTAQAQATVTNGVVTGITITNPGSGYINPPTITFFGGGGSNAAATATIDTNDRTKCYIPYANITNLTPIVVIAGSTVAGTFAESGFAMTPETGSDSEGNFFLVPGRDFSQVANNVYVGYRYDYDIELPKTYYQLDDEGKQRDFSANLTIARLNFDVGLSGVMGFKLKAKGRLAGSREYTQTTAGVTDFPWTPQDLSYQNRNQVKVKLNNVTKTLTTDYTFLSDTEIRFNTAPAVGDKILIYLDEWYDLQPSITADLDLADDVPLNESTVFTIPVHQRTENFSLRVFNDSPFPVSLNSMMWEGNYSPRFYRRT